MDKSRMGEIALLLIEEKVKRAGITLKVFSPREMGNISARTEIPVDELREFILSLVEKLLIRTTPEEIRRARLEDRSRDSSLVEFP